MRWIGVGAGVLAYLLFSFGGVCVAVLAGGTWAGGSDSSASTARWSLPGMPCTDTDRTPTRRSTSTWSMVTGGIGSPS
jgi:hypothetical protein